MCIWKICWLDPTLIQEKLILMEVQKNVAELQLHNLCLEKYQLYLLLGKGTCIRTLRSLLDEWSILSEQGSIFLENKLSKQVELSEQGEIFLQLSLKI